MLTDSQAASLKEGMDAAKEYRPAEVPFPVDNRPQWTKAVERIERYWAGIVGQHGPAGQFCIALSVFALGLLFALAMPWFITVSLKRAIIG